MLNKVKETLVPLLGIRKLFSKVYDKQAVDNIINDYENYITECRDKMILEIDILKSNINILETKCKDIDSYCNTVNMKNENLTNDKVTFLSKLKSKEKTIENLKGSLAELKSEITSKDGKNNAYLKEKAKSQANHILKLDRANTKLLENISLLKKEIIELKKKIR